MFEINKLYGKFLNINLDLFYSLSVSFKYKTFA